jgi:membrane peptidoglycan carboxypeptidase
LGQFTDRPPKRKVKGRRSNIAARLVAWSLALLLGAAAGLYVFWDLPPVSALSKGLDTPSVRITDRNGRLLYDILPREGGRHSVLSFERIPQCMKDATIAVEDKNFYTNPGIDFGGIARALWLNLRGGRTVAGGSTITQQVARNILLAQDERTEISIRRKLREAVLAVELTQKLSKEDILALYINQVNYGGMAYGVEAASQTYFGKPADELLLPECALLAGLPQAPGAYDPFTHPELAKQRQQVVLGLMKSQGYITEEQRAAADAAPMSYNPAPYPIEAPHFIWLVKDQLDALIAEGKISQGQSLVVRTTLDLDAQHKAEQIIARRLAAFQPKQGEIGHNVNNAAMVVLDAHTGEIRALVGSAGYFDEKIDGALDMATSPRQTGSAFKPFIYAEALTPSALTPSLPPSNDRTGSTPSADAARSLGGGGEAGGGPWTAATSILDVSSTFITHSGEPYVPKDYDGREHGPVPVRVALASSLNIPAVKTLQYVGIENTVELARRLGITSLADPSTYDLSLALGGGQISLLQLSDAYASLANGGYYIPSVAVLDVKDADGKLLYTEPRAAPVQVFDARVAWLISDILSDDRARETGFGLNSTLNVGFSAAVKTGTTTNFHDNWTMGYTPDLVVGVWVGNSNYEAMKDVSGVTGAAPIWNEMMRALHEGRLDKPFARPEGLKQVEVCDLSGLLPTPACTHARTEWFIDGTEPTQKDAWYQQVTVDAATGLLADESTPAARRKQVTVLDLPVQAQQWARTVGLPLLADVQQQSGAVKPNSLALLSPVPGTTYRITSEITASAQQLSVEAVASQAFAKVTLYADDAPLQSFIVAPYQTWWQLAAGEHRFYAEGVTAAGDVVRTDEVTITVVK